MLVAGMFVVEFEVEIAVIQQQDPFYLPGQGLNIYLPGQGLLVSFPCLSHLPGRPFKPCHGF